ncbi:MAG: hypothetical protein ABIS36_10720 [Chryseolinea sp.]
MERLTAIGIRLIVLTLGAWFMSCSDKDEFKPALDVPTEWQPFLERFKTEAAARGRVINITNLIIRNDNKLDESHCGECNTVSLDPNVQKIIGVNPNTVCWFTDEAKEVFIFHELGHCILGRDHEGSSLPNGSPKSIMIPNDLILYEGCQYPIGGDGSCDHRERRAYYIDELFDPSTPVPGWAD